MIDGGVLLDLARRSIVASLGGPSYVLPDVAWLHQPGASFVTLTEGGALRGCVGTVEAWRLLGEDVMANACSAASRDPRFPPLRSMHELEAIQVEVSLLSRPETLHFEYEDELYALLRPGIDGLILRHAAGQATFLPQVWEQLPDPRAFVAQLLRKAGNSVSLQGCLVQRYTVDKWCEADGTTA